MLQSSGAEQLWCIGIQKSDGQDITILGGTKNDHNFCSIKLKLLMTRDLSNWLCISNFFLVLILASNSEIINLSVVLVLYENYCNLIIG